MPIYKPVFREELRAQDFASARIPERYRRAKLDQVYPGAREQLVKYCDNFQRLRTRGDASLIVFGQKGVGKSCVASLALQHGLRWGCSGLFETFSEFRRHLFERLPYDGEDLMIDRLGKVDILVMDDIDPIHIQKTFPLGEFIALIKARHAREKTTIVTSRSAWSELPFEISDTFKSCLVPLIVSGPDRWAPGAIPPDVEGAK